jgi:two-component system, NtrC family, response regulator HydG
MIVRRSGLNRALSNLSYSSPFDQMTRKDKSASILVVDDDQAHRYMLGSMLQEWGWRPTEADDGATAVAAVKEQPFDAILMDVRMTVMDGMAALKKIHAFNPAIPVVIMTAYSSVDDAVQAIKIGAHDYLTKPLDFNRLRLTLEKALDHHQVEEAKVAGRGSADFDPGTIIGDSPAMRELLEMVSYVAPTEATVLITGESGTGKELIASAVHRNSTRRHNSFVKVNCAALVETLLETELFGHERGAFTGADRRREGKFVQADHGTIFLDEIGEMSPAMQAKLLRVLQEQEVQRVGGEETLKIDVRVLAATNRILEDEVKLGRFREDLFYRLNVVTLPVPALRKRPGDLPRLVDYFLSKFAARNRRQLAGVTPRCMDLLIHYPWPGNVRELENAMERGVILMRGEYLDEESLPVAIRQWAEAEFGQGAATGKETPTTLEEAERQVILRTLEESGGNKSEAARRLNITRKTLFSKLRKYNAVD